MKNSNLSKKTLNNRDRPQQAMQPQLATILLLGIVFLSGAGVAAWFAGVGII